MKNAKSQHRRKKNNMEKMENEKMKSLGIVRKVDELGRIVLPIETRRRLELEPGDGVEIFVEKDRVILKKYEPSCLFCGDADDIVVYKDKRICKNCLAELQGMAGAQKSEF